MIPDILGRIVERKSAELKQQTCSNRDFEERATAFTRRSFSKALSFRKPAIIAEIKKASPSQGVLSETFQPAVIARQYEAGGAAAISILTDRDFFQGSLADLEAARASTSLPVLRKDFTTSEYHVREAAAHGADAILLIASILDIQQLRSFRELAARFEMDCLVEVHDEEELDCAVASGAQIIGVNNRDLRTFEVRLEVSHRLASRIPAGILRVTESGVFTPAHIQELSAYQAFLVGESLMRSPDPCAAVRLLLS